MSDNRPLDALDEAKGKRVIVRVRPQGDQEKSSEIVGELKAFDLHLNLWLEDAQRKEGETTTKFGTIVVRGDNVLFVSPE